MSMSFRADLQKQSYKVHVLPENNATHATHANTSNLDNYNDWMVAWNFVFVFPYVGNTHPN